MHGGSRLHDLQEFHGSIQPHACTQETGSVHRPLGGGGKGVGEMLFSGTATALLNIFLEISMSYLAFRPRVPNALPSWKLSGAVTCAECSQLATRKGEEENASGNHKLRHL